jgi:hypothetical protein
METRPPTRPLTTTEEIAISLAAIADQLDTMNSVLERVAEALEARLKTDE